MFVIAGKTGLVVIHQQQSKFRVLACFLFRKMLARFPVISIIYMASLHLCNHGTAMTAFREAEHLSSFLFLHQTANH